MPRNISIFYLMKFSLTRVNLIGAGVSDEIKEEYDKVTDVN
ncbi:hypothetical protein J2Z83_003709 [Virgibacillus natechei]|uniref:Uncharacterized protein n=1 Tax=Virgibacillus natechei TaxID=1216297 RepID=A0ABS4IL08_9BACI|nr:hypothetical protein [Virgibacillus natechei]